MLIKIDPILSPELLFTLRSMGHGDKLVLADANFPAHSMNENVVRLDGVNIKDAGMKGVTVVGFDATPDAAKSILAGDMTATIAQFSYDMGAYGVKYALALANGEKIDLNIDTGTQLVTTGNANDFK